MARGAARMLGFELMKNFNLPFLASSLTDFWKRWHISLSTWLRDYIYEPLALRWRNGGIIGIALALMVTFFISGLWHGAQWTFIFWGLAHGIALVIELFSAKLFRVKDRIFPKKIGTLLGIVRTFLLVCISYIFFRAESLTNAIDIFDSLLDLQISYDQLNFINFNKTLVIGHSIWDFIIISILVICLMVIEKAQAEDGLVIAFKKLPRYFQVIIYQVFFVILITYGVWFTNHASFIYFQF
jgi:D-alanyl-lipoteichoic acid acyltransferase DltB (MBOAT superfamily)